ncbi:tRNA (guanosine(46)-N7)-methyltransferase TrmB [Caproiciproducens sp. LBM24188]|nr:tRNA (guanosine(46)-N7)-methyltransferase TrmB [Oscillospiraceae bacterium]
MRMRNKPWAAPELDACPFFVRKPEAYSGRWHEFFPRRQPLHLELGCGKGVFLAELAPKTPEINYLGIDLKDTVLGPGKRLIEQAFHEYGKEPDNVVLTAHDIEQILTMMNEQDTVERIYINFCNPWPKPKHWKRRLTHPRQLEKYKTFLAKDGEIWFKTDDENLFADSLHYMEESGFDILRKTTDLHGEEHPEQFAELCMTEHEKMFLEKGIKIKAFIAKIRS